MKPNGATLPAWFPGWARRMGELSTSGSTSVFLLYGNTFDFVPLSDGAAPAYGSVAQFLAEQMFGRYDLVLHYDLGRGLRAFAGRDDKRLRDMVTLANQEISGFSDMQPKFAGARKHPRKFAGRVPQFGRIEPDPVDARQVRLGLRQGRKCFLFAQVAQETHQQPICDVKLRLTLFERTFNTVEHGLKFDPPHGVALGVKKDLNVADLVGFCAFEIGPGQVEKVLLGQQHRHALIINIKEILKVREIICRPNRFDRIKRDRHPIALRQLKQQLRLERTLDVQVQLGLGQAVNQRGAGIRIRHGRDAGRAALAGQPPCSHLPHGTNHGAADLADGRNCNRRLL